MQTIAVHVRRAAPVPDLGADLRVARVLAVLMDSQFQVGSIRFGLDSLVGLVPVAGDLIALTVGTYPIYLARKHGLGRTVIARMWANLAVDFVGGLVPIVGDAFDVVYKANLKNLKLLEDAGKHKGLL